MVVFDQRAAAAAIEECRRAMAVVDDVLGRHARFAASATEAWEGPHRSTFDERFVQLQAELELRRSAIAAIRARVEYAAAAARLAEQRAGG